MQDFFLIEDHLISPNDLVAIHICREEITKLYMAKMYASSGRVFKFTSATPFPYLDWMKETAMVLFSDDEEVLLLQTWRVVHVFRSRNPIEAPLVIISSEQVPHYIETFKPDKFFHEIVEELRSAFKEIMDVECDCDPGEQERSGSGGGDRQGHDHGGELAGCAAEVGQG